MGIASQLVATMLIDAALQGIAEARALAKYSETTLLQTLALARHRQTVGLDAATTSIVHRKRLATLPVRPSRLASS